MNKQRTIRHMFLAIALVALAGNGAALAQPVTFTGMIDNGTGTPTVDVYSFVLGAGEGITLDINTSNIEFDTVLSVVDPLKRQRDDLITMQDDPASTNPFDPYVQFTADTPGTWTVSVTANPLAPSGGFYELLVTRVPGSTAPEYLTINIDIKPNNPHNATPIKMGERHIRVALLSDRKKGFDPFEINVDSLRFGPTGNEESLVRCAKKRGKDRNGDRKPDRVCRFDNAKAGFTLMNTVGMVKGTTRDGKAFQGSADVKVLAQRHHKDRKHHDDDDDD